MTLEMKTASSLKIQASRILIFRLIFQSQLPRLMKNKEKMQRIGCYSVNIAYRTEHRLTTRPLAIFSAEIYEASSWCYQCNTDYEICVVTGICLLRILSNFCRISCPSSTKINCTSCAKSANREDWNKFLLQN